MDRLSDREVVEQYPKGTRVCRVEDEHDTGRIIDYDDDGLRLRVGVRWSTGYETYVVPEYLRPLGK